MDPVSAIGLAASVAQLVDLSYKLVSAGVEVWEVASESHKSTDGKTATNRHAEVTARDFIIVTERLSSSIDSCKLSPDAGHGALADLAGASVKIGEELLEHLEKARVRERHRLWQSFRKAVESVWSKGDIENVAQKLRGYREQIQYHVLVSMRDQVKWIDLHSSTQFNSLDESAKKILTALYNNEQIFTDRLEISTNEVKQHVTDEIRPVKDGLQYLNNGVEQVLLILRTPSPGGVSIPHPIDHQPERTLLHEAAEAGRLPEVQEILRLRPSEISARNEDGRNALHIATMSRTTHGYEDIVKCLLARRLDPNAEDHGGRSALHYAAENGHATMVRYLLLKGADKKAEDFNGHQPRHVSEPHSIVNWMLLNGPDVDVKDVRQRTALNNAAERGDNLSVRWLLDNNANTELMNEWGLTPLAEASRHGHCDTVKMLIDHGANLEAATETKKTPLWRAVEKGQAAIVRQLLEKKAKTDISAHDGRTPLIVATEKDFTEIVRLLLVNGAATECAEPQKRTTPLMIAAREGYTAVLLELLKNGAKMNAVNKDGNSALAHACKGRGQADVVRILLEKGAAIDINKKNKNGHTPLTHAACYGWVPISKALLDNGADIDSETKEGLTAMKIAVDKRHEDLARFLLDRGALAKKK